MLASHIGHDEDSAVVGAMEKANVVDLVDTPRPQAAIAWEDGTSNMNKVFIGQGLKSCLAICEEAVDGLIGVLHHGA